VEPHKVHKSRAGPRPNFGNALAFVLYLGVASTKQVQQVKCGGKALLLQEEDGSFEKQSTEGGNCFSLPPLFVLPINFR